MIYLFEDLPYSAKYLEKLIDLKNQDGFNTLETSMGTKLNGVGYLHTNERSVFVLPKVFIQKDNAEYTAFGKKISDVGDDVFGDETKTFENSALVRKFLSGLGLWLYSAIDKYRQSIVKKNDGVKSFENLESVKFKQNERCSTLPDIVSSMELFYKKNQSLFVFVAKCKLSGNHKIDWHKTISRKTPILQNGAPIYMETVNKVKAFDLDDRLLVLYFSAMNYIQAVYGLTMPKSEFYKPLRVEEIKRLMDDERGVRELRRIKYKYFDDRLLKLYNIMENFFRWGAEFSKGHSEAREYLIVNSFNNVFEAMMDDLVSDPDAAVERLKSNKDGKVIDHLYKERSLVFADGSENDRIWHIGDSKYYKDFHDLGTKAIAKQFTYAKNLMQDFFSPKFFDDGNIHQRDVHKSIRYRDPLTEGYSVTPNFFIRGELPEFKGPSQYAENYFRQADDNRLIYQADKASVEDENDPDKEKQVDSMEEYLWSIRNRHFANRLFDRDTLLLQVYNVNFLYVLKAYTAKGSGLRDHFRNEARNMFRRNFLDLLGKKYAFWAVWPKTNWNDGDAVFKTMAEQMVDVSDASTELKALVLKYDRLLAGKMFCPAGFTKCLLVALEKGSDDTKLWEVFEPDCAMILPMSPSEIWDDKYYVDKREQEHIKNIDSLVLDQDAEERYFVSLKRLIEQGIA